MAAHITQVDGGISNNKGSNCQETSVEEVIDVINYDERSFPDLGVPDYCYAESKGNRNSWLVENDRVIPPSIFQECYEAMEGPPMLSTEVPGLGIGLDRRNVLRILQASQKLF